jgi:hypothetical protein
MEGDIGDLTCIVDSVWSVDSVGHMRITCGTGSQFGVFNLF